MSKLWKALTNSRYLAYCGLMLMALSAVSASADELSTLEKPLSVQAAADTGVQQGLVGTMVIHMMSNSGEYGIAGVRELGHPAPLSPHDLFAIGSNGKAMTAAVAARLVEQGKVRWDSSLAEVLPQLLDSMRPEYRLVTLEQLLNHQGGVWAFTTSEEFAYLFQHYDGYIPSERSQQRLAFSRWVLQQTPPEGIVPGSSYLYSNAGYTLVSAMLETVSGISFEQLLLQELAQPLGISDQLVFSSPRALSTEQPIGHYGTPKELQVLPSHLPEMELLNQVMLAAGGFSMTPKAYAVWLQAHLLAFQGQATALPSSYIAKLKASPNDHYTLGWVQLPVNGRARLLHLGANYGFTSFTLLDLAGRDASFAFSNTASYQELSWVSELLQVLLLQVDRNYYYIEPWF